MELVTKMIFFSVHITIATLYKLDVRLSGCYSNYVQIYLKTSHNIGDERRGTTSVRRCDVCPVYVS